MCHSNFWCRQSFLQPTKSLTCSIRAWLDIIHVLKVNKESKWQEKTNKCPISSRCWRNDSRIQVKNKQQEVRNNFEHFELNIPNYVQNCQQTACGSWWLDWADNNWQNAANLLHFILPQSTVARPILTSSIHNSSWLSCRYNAWKGPYANAGRKHPQQPRRQHCKSRQTSLPCSLGADDSTTHIIVTLSFPNAHIWGWNDTTLKWQRKPRCTIVPQFEGKKRKTMTEKARHVRETLLTFKKETRFHTQKTFPFPPLHA